MPDTAPETRFLDAYDRGRYPGLALRVDLVIATVQHGVLQTVSYTRTRHPFLGDEALPGEFVGPRESLHQAARRVCDSRLGIGPVALEQLFTFGDPARDPRMRVLSSAWLGLVPPSVVDRLAPGVQLRSVAVPWAGESGGPAGLLDGDGRPMALAFDHADMLGLLVQRLRGKLRYAPVAYALLPGTFTLRALQTVHEAVLDQPLNKDSFRRTALASGELEPTGTRQQGVDHRPARLYRWTNPRGGLPWPR